MADDLLKFLNLSFGVMLVSMAGTFGIYAVCKLTKWAPVNITVNINNAPDYDA